MYLIVNYVPMNDDEAIIIMVMMHLEAEGFFQTKADVRG
jgi:hypothetical protein